VISRAVLLLLLPVIAGISLFQRRRLAAVIGMGLFSLVLAATYLLHSAPDVAVTEAAIGAALVTVIYVLAIRRTGRLLVVGDEVPGLLALEGGEFVGVEVDILAGFARRLGLDLSIQIAALRDVETILLRGDADLGAGGLSWEPRTRLHRCRDHLPTALLRLRLQSDDHPMPEESPTTDRCEYAGYFSDLVEAFQRDESVEATLDMARFLAVSRTDISRWSVDRLSTPRAYAFLAAPRRKDLRDQLSVYIDELERNGSLDDMFRRHLP
jgi:uncharacterized MnhB-related membrane protein